MNSIDLEIKARSAGKVKGRSLPWLNQWQYGRELWGDQDFYKMINEYKSWIYICANKNSTAAASIPLRLYVAKSKKGQKVKGFETKEVSKNQFDLIKSSPLLCNISSVRKAADFEEVLEHPWLDLKTSVNSYMNAFDLFEMTYIYLDLTGNAYWYMPESRLGIPQEIWIISPADIRVIPDRKNFIAGYEYEKGGEKIFLNESQIIHFKTPNPRSYYYGASPISAIAEEFGLYKSINQYETQMFSNQGVLSGTFETEQELSEFEFDRLRSEIRQAFSGPRNTGIMPLLDHGLKFKPMVTSTKELSYLGGRESIREIILNTFHQSLAMYSKESNRANVQAAVYQMMKFGIKPKLLRTEQKLNEKMMGKYSNNLFVLYDECVPDDREEVLNERIKNIQTSVTSVDEERNKMGLNPLGGIFDKPLIPVNYLPPEGILANIANGTGEGKIVSDPKQLKDLLERNK